MAIRTINARNAGKALLDSSADFVRKNPEAAESIANEAGERARSAGQDFVQEVLFGSQLENEPERLMYEWLEPNAFLDWVLPGEGYYHSPAEPVDPWDCAKWPNSIACEGAQPIGDPLGIEPEITRSGCETCVTFTPSLAYISLPPYTVCKRDPACIKDPIEWEDVTPGTEGNYERQYCKDGVMVCFVDADKEMTQTGSRTWFPITEERDRFWQKVYARNIPLYIERDPFNFPIRHMEVDDFFKILGEVERELYAEEKALFEQYNQPVVDTFSGQRPYRTMTARILKISYSDINDRALIGGDYPRQIDLVSAYLEVDTTIFTTRYQQSFGTRDNWFFVTNDIRVSWPACDPYERYEPGQPPLRVKHRIQPGGDDEMACCEENSELLRLIAKRLGTQDFPATVPRSLFGKEANKSQKIESLTQLLGWYIQQFDALIGEWPINIEIQDIDPTTKGKQKVKIELPNLAEAMAEVFGLNQKTAVDGDIILNFLMRFVSEVTAIKNSSLITQDYVRANASYLGYRGNPKKREIPYAFDPENLDNLEDVLRPTTKSIIGWEESDPDTAAEYFQRLMFSAGIIKSLYFRSADDAARLAKEIFGLENGDADLKDQNELWKQFISALNEPNSRFNQNSPKPKVRDLSQNTGEGQTNFLDDIIK